MKTNHLIRPAINTTDYHTQTPNVELELEDSDSLQIRVQNVQAKTHKDFHIKYQDQTKKLTLYIDLCPADIQNLMKEGNLLRNRNDSESKRIKNCIFFRKIQTPNSKISGNFYITYLQYQGLTFHLYLNRLSSEGNTQATIPLCASEKMFARLKIAYDNDDQTSEKKFLSKWVESSFQNDTFSFSISFTTTQVILKNHLLLQIIIDRYPPKCYDYSGLQNQDNFCYINSLIQVLYHFLPLRKMIIEYPKSQVKNKELIKNLQEIFVDLSDGKITPCAEGLLKVFPKFSPSQNRRQQDIHEFMIKLFDEIEKQCPKAKHFWCGKDIQLIRSTDGRYSSKQEQDFNQLQLHITDIKGNSLKTIKQAIKELLVEEKVQDELETQQFGKIKVCRNRSFQILPPLLFLNIKRYEYNTKRKELRKINLDQRYDLEFDAGFLLDTEKDEHKYVLYAVVVHKGRSPHSGHYFSLINLSKDPSNPQFYEFNDTNVSKINTKKVLEDYTGKKKKQFYLSQLYGKWGERQIDSEETAYMLTYILKQKFSEFQSLEYNLPSWHLERLQTKLTQEQAKTKIQCKIISLTQEQDFVFFTTDHNFIQGKLNKNNSIEEQIHKLQQYFEKNAIGTIWKVNIKGKNIKYTGRTYGEKCKVSLHRFCEYKQGFRQPDYFLLINKAKSAQINKKKSIGILHTQEITESETKWKVEIIEKTQIDKILKEMQEKGFNLTYKKQELQYFQYDWNDYLYIKKQ